MNRTKFSIYRDKAGEYRWQLIARNGEIVAASEGYTTKQSAIDSAKKVSLWASEAEIVDETSDILANLFRN